MTNEELWNRNIKLEIRHKDMKDELDAAKAEIASARNKALDEAVAAIYSKLKERHNTSSPDFDNGCIGGFQYSIWAIEALKEQG